MKAKVAVLKTSPETVIEDYGRLMRMAGYADHLPKDKKTHLKINISWHVWFPACSTAPWQLEGVIKTLLDDGYDQDSIYLTQNRTAVVDDRVGEVNNGLATVAHKYGLEFTRLYEPPVDWVPYEPGVGLPALEDAYGQEGLHVPDIFPDTNVIQLPTLKTHAFTGTTGAMKNAIGGLLQEHRRWNHDTIDEAVVDLLALQKEIHSGVFAVMDGTLCGDGPGPRMLTPYIKDYLLAGADQVAVDTVAAHMMGFDPMEIRYIRLAHERGLGCGVFEDIEIEGEDVAAVDFQFRGGKGGLDLPDMAAKLYQDYFWYPFIGWQRVNQVAETKWGQLLQGYLPEGAELENQGQGKGTILAAAAAAAFVGMSAFHRVARLAGSGR